jgi:hypothetical protein
MSDAPDTTPPHGDPLRPVADPDTSPSDIPAPEPVDGPDRGGDTDPGAGAD